VCSYDLDLRLLSPSVANNGSVCPTTQVLTPGTGMSNAAQTAYTTGAFFAALKAGGVYKVAVRSHTYTHTQKVG
jgi:hypothetical protein